MNYPDYIIVGAAKCGTTSLSNYLGEHPDIIMTQPKELNFFGRKNIEQKLEDYSKHFQPQKGKIVGEGSVSYILYSKLAAPQIKKYAPNVKIIVMLRNPVDRFYSDFWFNVNRGAVSYKKGLFDDVIDDNYKINPFPALKMSYRESLISKGMYSEHLKDYFEHFDKDQVKIVFFEDFKNDLEGVLNSIYKFLEVKPIFTEKTGQIFNKTKYPGKFNFLYVAWKKVKPYLPKQFVDSNKNVLVKLKRLVFTESKHEFTAQSRSKLLKIYSDSILELEELLDKDLSHWKK